MKNIVTTDSTKDDAARWQALFERARDRVSTLTMVRVNGAVKIMCGVCGFTKSRANDDRMTAGEPTRDDLQYAMIQHYMDRHPRELEPVTGSALKALVKCPKCAHEFPIGK